MKTAMSKNLGMFVWIAVLALAPASVRATLVQVEKTGPLHYTNEPAFDNQWRATISPDNMDIVGLDGDYALRHGLYAGDGFRVYDAVDASSATDISVFNVSSTERVFRASTDFRIWFGGGENLWINLAAVSPNGNNSYMAAYYDNAFGTPGGHFRFDNFNFNTGVGANLGLTSGPALDADKWYQLEYSMTRQTDAPGSLVDLNVSVYSLVGDIKGNPRNALLGSYALNNLANMGDFVQFGMKSGATAAWAAFTDNFAAEATVPEPSSVLLLALGGLLAWRGKQME